MSTFLGAVKTEIRDAEGVVWTRFDYGDNVVLYQRDCTDCDKGLLYAPVRFHGACGGSGYITGTPA